MPPTREEIDELEIPRPPAFRGLNPQLPIHIYSRNLPHWRQEGATYFVTFRQADSIPQGAREEMAGEVENWRNCIERATQGGKTLPKSLKDEYEQFLRRYGTWLDNHLDACHGSCHLRNPDLRKIVVDSLPDIRWKRSSNRGKASPLSKSTNGCRRMVGFGNRKATIGSFVAKSIFGR